MESKTQIPGIAARHAIITPACRGPEGEGAMGAFEEAVNRVRQEYIACEAQYATKANFHLVLTVERARNDRR